MKTPELTTSMEGADARSKVQHKAKAKIKPSNPPRLQQVSPYSTSTYLSAVTGRPNVEAEKEALQAFKKVQARKTIPTPAQLNKEEHTFMKALDAVAPPTAHERFMERETPAPPPPSPTAPATGAAGSGAGSAAGEAATESPNPAATATSREEAEKLCADAAAGGNIEEEQPVDENATPEPIVDPSSQPVIRMPDGSTLPLPQGCAPFNKITEEPPLEPGEGPCAPCEDTEVFPVYEIQILEWLEGRMQPIVIGKQLLNVNKSAMMEDLLTGELDHELEQMEELDRKMQGEINGVKKESDYQAEEYAAGILSAAEHSMNEKIESGLAQAMNEWGLSSTFGKVLDDAPEGALLPEEIARLKEAGAIAPSEKEAAKGSGAGF